MVIPELDDVQYDLEVDGQQVRRQISRKIWEAKGWATVAITFEERASDGTWKDKKVALYRFRRMHDAWKKQSSITLSASEAQEVASWVTTACAD
jgi:hypothetical protein